MGALRCNILGVTNINISQNITHYKEVNKMTELNSHAQYQGRIKHLPVKIEDTNSLNQLVL